MSGEKTEEPTYKRLRDARRDGQVARSTDFTEAIILSGAVLGLSLAAPMIGATLEQMLTIALDFMQGPRNELAMFAALERIARAALMPVLVIAGVAAVAALAGQMPQVGLQVTMKPIIPNAEAINPMAGLKRMFSVRSLLELAKMLFKSLLLAFILYEAIRSVMPLIATSVGHPVTGVLTVFWGLLLRLLAIASLVFVIFGALDIKLQRMLFLKKMKMSKDEVKREYKQDEGDPQIKGERRRLARQWASEPPGGGAAVKAANVLFVNPTHYAVALRYEPGEHPLPRVIAKGADAEAAVLRRQAQAFGVPVVGNPPVARALFKVETGGAIPEELFETVAVILRWLDSLRAAPALETSQASQTPQEA